MDLADIEHPDFKKIYKELNGIYLISQGRMMAFYYRYLYTRYTGLYYNLGPVTREWEYPWAIINARIEKGQRILDAGCGSSPLPAYLHKHGYLCYGLDNKFQSEVILPDMITAKTRFLQHLSRFYPFYLLFNPHQMVGISAFAKTLRLPLDYIKGDLLKQPFADESFDRIFCISTLEHLSSEGILKAAVEFRRVLKPGGLLISTVDCAGNGLSWREFIKTSGLSLYGETDFDRAPLKRHTFDVVGFVLQKK